MLHHHYSNYFSSCYTLPKLHTNDLFDWTSLSSNGFSFDFDSEIIFFMEPKLFKNVSKQLFSGSVVILRIVWNLRKKKLMNLFFVLISIISYSGISLALFGWDRFIFMYLLELKKTLLQKPLSNKPYYFTYLVELYKKKSYFLI